MDSGPRLLAAISIPPFVVESGVALTWVGNNASNTAQTFIYKAGDTSKKLFNLVPANYLDNGGSATIASAQLTLAYRLL
jgi:hypothetical protein